jgi:hypothetical protein
MNSEGFALNQIIIMAQPEMRLAIAQLQVEDKGREVAKLQGRVAGYKNLIANIAGNFHLTQTMLDDNGDEPVKIPDLKDEELDIVNYDARILLEREEWKAVMERVESNIYSWKNSLFYDGECVRDLDLTQGKYQGQKIFENFFNAVQGEVERRAKEAAEKAKQPSLFDEGGKILAFESAASGQ